MRAPRRKHRSLKQNDPVSRWRSAFSWLRAIFLLSLSAVAWVTLRWQYAQSVTPNLHTPTESAIRLSAFSLRESAWHWVGETSPLTLLFTFVSEHFLGPSLLSARVPNMIAGVLLPLAVFGLVKVSGGSRLRSVLAAICIVASPWSWHFASVIEPNFIALLFTILAATCFLRRSHQWWSDIIGACFVAASWLTAPVAVTLLPLFVGVLFVTRKDSSMSLGWAGLSVGVSCLLFAGVSQVVQWTPLLVIRAISLEELRLLVDWTFLVSRGGSIPWDGIPNTGYLNGFVTLLTVAVSPLALAVFWKDDPQSWQRKTLLIGGVILFTLGTILPVFFDPMGVSASSLVFFFTWLSILGTLGISELWKIVSREFPVWSVVGLWLIFAGWLSWHTLLWILPAQVRWKYYISPTWNQGFVEAWQKEVIQLPEQVIVVDESGVLAPIVLIHDASLRETYWRDFSQYAPDSLQEIGKYRFMPRATESAIEQGTMLLRPRSNTEWDIIKL